MNEHPSPPSNELTIVIVKLARQGDADAFTTLYKWYYTDIYKHLVRIVENEQDATDLAQETFFKAWKGLSGLYDGRMFRNWLYSIATHTALDHLQRKRFRKPFWEHSKEDDIYEPIEELKNRVEERELVELALQQIAPKPRASLLLRLEGFNQGEIAEMMGLHRKSVGTYVSIAREQFHRAYYRLEQENDSAERPRIEAKKAEFRAMVASFVDELQEPYQTAEQLNLKEGTVKSHVSRGMKMLQERLKQE